MPKIIALQTDDKNLATTLQQAGYKVVGLYDAPGSVRVDAILYKSYDHRLSSNIGYSDIADISISQRSHFDSTSPKSLNISGLSPDKILTALKQHLYATERGDYPFI